MAQRTWRMRTFRGTRPTGRYGSSHLWNSGLPGRPKPAAGVYRVCVKTKSWLQLRDHRHPHHSRSPNTPRNTTMEMTPFIVKKAASSLLRSVGLTSLCSQPSRSAARATPA
jgi:hypothetical protein